MPIHPAIASRFAMLDGIVSFEVAMADPVQRKQLEAFMSGSGLPPPQVETRAAEVVGPHGPVPVRLYLPDEPGPDRPALVWMHGGAFRGGDLDMPEADRTARELCERAGAVVVSVDYRLCVGGVRYPVPHDDVVATYRWARDHATDLSIDGTRISIGGASAGGCLAIGAALKVRDEDGQPPAALLAVYPVAHAVIPAPSASLTASMAEVPAPLRFFPPLMQSINETYLGGPLSTADGYAFGAQAVLEGLCPTLTINAEYDDLRPSGEDFVARCALAGVDVEQVTAVGMLHGFLNMGDPLEPVQRALDLMAELIRGGARKSAAAEPTALR